MCFVQETDDTTECHVDYRSEKGGGDQGNYGRDGI